MGNNCCCKERRPDSQARSVSLDLLGPDDQELSSKETGEANGRESLTADGKPQKLGRKAVGCGAGKKPKRKPESNAPPKSPEEEQLISSALRRNQFLKSTSNMDRARIAQLVKVARKEPVKKGVVLIQEGDLNGESFYIVQKGKFKMTSTGKNQSRAKSTVTALAVDADGDGILDAITLEMGSSFGELALLYLEPRSATVQATEESEVWVIDRQDFKDILMKVPEEKIKEYVKHLQEVASLNCLVDEERTLLAQELVDVGFAQDEQIIEQGANGNTFYILYEGEVAIVKDEAVVSMLSASVELGRIQYFGEAALLDNEIRTATVKVVSDEAHTLAIDRETFESLLRPLHDIIDISKKEGAERKAAVCGDDPEMKPTPSQRDPQREFVDRDRLVTLGFLGRGGFGYVELAEHKDTAEVYALKSLEKGYIVEKGMQQNVMNEKNIQSSLKNRFIVRLFETYTESTRLLFLIEPALGGELFQVYQKHDFFGSAKHAQFYSAGIVFAFEYLHVQNIVYRDLKPENMLLTDKGHVKLTDMGLAKKIKGKTFTSCGTPDYFAPEIVKQIGHGMAVDWWELGVLIFELMVGYPPFAANDPMEIFRKISVGIDRVTFPSAGKGVVEDLVKQLCKRTASERLPMRAGGTKNIRQHPWFVASKFDWEAMQIQTLTPPFKPAVNGPKDLSNFPQAPGGDRPDAPYTDDGSGWDKDFATKRE